MGMAATVWMCGECLQWSRPVGCCYSLRRVVHSPRGINPKFWVPRKSQAA